MPEPLLVAKAPSDLHLLPQFANRHGLIAGATGTGKTVTLQRIAEGLSRDGAARPPETQPGLGARTTFFSAVARTSDSHT
jgi:hypothetical protein